ncbi:MAG: peptidoglycan editing factor PgeF [Acidiferrobacterales bacterium]|nr:peptidoglycan editing factor PgeF [Acidiferrobacterales bacterium]
MALEFIKPNWPAPSNVRAVSTTRLGGVSRGIYESFNLGLHVGDEPERVWDNRIQLVNELSLSQQPLWLEQTHSTKLVKFRESETPVAADASYTTESNEVCAVMTADCLPLLLTDNEGTQVAAVHAGWRGLAEGIIEQSVASFSLPNNRLLAWTGPCIGEGAFEVGLEVKQRLGGPQTAYRSHSDPQKVYANLSLLAEHRLRALGVERIYHSEMCTHDDSARFFSYRRDGQTGRMASLIWLTD